MFESKTKGKNLHLCLQWSNLTLNRNCFHLSLPIIQNRRLLWTLRFDKWKTGLKSWPRIWNTIKSLTHRPMFPTYTLKMGCKLNKILWVSIAIASSWHTCKFTRSLTLLWKVKAYKIDDVLIPLVGHNLMWGVLKISLGMEEIILIPKSLKKEKEVEEKDNS